MRTPATLTLAFVLLARVALAQTSLESATLGTTGWIGGTSITDQQFVGWRFQVDQTFRVAEVGGHLLGFTSPGDEGPIFGALIRLNSLDSFPVGAPLLPTEVVASALFSPPFPSDEILVPLSATLEPGAYALVFGSGLFGATGSGAIHNGPDQQDIPPTTLDSYIFWGVPSPGVQPLWRGQLASQMRFIVRSAADRDQDGIDDEHDLCPYYASPDQTDTDEDGRGNVCECGDQDGDGRNTVADLVAINQAIFNPAQVTPLCDANDDELCNVGDIIGANAEIFSPASTSTCSRQPVPGP
jgi:hypothetical protein